MLINRIVNAHYKCIFSSPRSGSQASSDAHFTRLQVRQKDVRFCQIRLGEVILGAMLLTRRETLGSL